jgi:hypothetical protein
MLAALAIEMNKPTIIKADQRALSPFELLLEPGLK